MRSDRAWDEALAWYGDRVRRRRAAAGMSQRAFASHVGVHPSTMSRIEHGLMRGTKLEIIARVELELMRRRV